MENIPVVFWIVPIASIVALVMAWVFFSSMMKADEGTPRMREIAEYVRKGAMAYLKQQYKVVLIVFIILAVIFAIMPTASMPRILGCRLPSSPVVSSVVWQASLA